MYAEYLKYLMHHKLIISHLINCCLCDMKLYSEKMFNFILWCFITQENIVINSMHIYVYDT